MKDINGNHIIIKFIQIVQNNQMIYNIILNNILEISTNKHGCCILQKGIDFATPQQRKAIISKLIESSYLLMCDAFGNYVMQYVICLDDFEVNNKIANSFIQNIAYLSKQKFSSNVIEKVTRVV